MEDIVLSNPYNDVRLNNSFSLSKKGISVSPLRDVNNIVLLIGFNVTIIFNSSNIQGDIINKHYIN